jgi:diacylglycerol kinase (ATP)
MAVKGEPPFVIVNPRAGGGLAGKTFPELRRVVESRLGRCDVAATERPGHAIDLARDEATRGRALIIAVGGDGTLHEVANGVLDAGGGGATRIGVIGQGTGGDFRRTLGIEHRLDRYIDAIASGRERAVDVGKLTYRAGGETRTRWFLNIVSAGLGGLVDRYVAESRRTLGGSAAYAIAGARALTRARVGRMTCATTLAGIREARQIEGYIVAICNGRYFGGGMHIAPMASPDDGRFDVITMMAPSKLALTMLSRKLYDAGHIGAPGVTCFACDTIDLTLDNTDVSDVFLLDVDGEPLGGLPIHVTLVPRALRICG